MRDLYLFLTIFMAQSCIGSCSPDIGDDPMLVSDLRFSPSAFDSFKRNTELRFSLNYPSAVSISVVKCDSSGETTVRTLLENVGQTKGSHSVTWLGDTDKNLFAPAGIYLGIVRISRRRFETPVQVFHF